MRKYRNSMRDWRNRSALRSDNFPNRAMRRAAGGRGIPGRLEFLVALEEGRQSGENPFAEEGTDA